MDVAKMKYDQLLQVRVPNNLLAKAKAKSKLTGISLSHVVRTGLDIFVRSAQWPAVFGLELKEEEEPPEGQQT